MHGENLTIHEALVLILMAIGGLMMFIDGLFGDTFHPRYTFIGMLLCLFGLTILHWITAILAWSLPAWILLTWARGEFYAKRFPVFEVPPIDTFRDENGFTHYLHIREWKSRFIIGIDFEDEVDGTVLRNQTRWKDRFLSHTTAEVELRRRFSAWKRDEITIWP
ncbi:MAG: hypothetical protein WAV95_03900 [Azonexus sp.]